ncbi:MAG: ABC transporter ATP-binding protein, partial [Phascolarctobacterium sp.]|nr:ABC transporter ATP-binding protein [Candidatus Phascolarctobacterium caballi]
MLKIENLVVSYGGIEALKGVSLQVPDGKIVTLIGANGAGKSTLLRSVIGLVKANTGSVIYDDIELLGLNSQKIVEKGITLVPEGRRIFPNLTVAENLQIGAYMRSDKKGIADDVKRVYELFPRLEERSWQMAGTLSGGEQQMLAVGRALMSRPKLMMMDEPSLGLAPLVIKDIFAIIERINKQ